MRSIFRVYDIRGVYGRDLTEKTMELIGNSLARLLKDDRVVVARDTRSSSVNLNEAFIRGFTKTGKDAIDVGMLPLGTGMFYAWKREIPFAYITASHLSKEWNGVKFFHKNAIGFLEEDNNKVRDMVLEGEMIEKGNGSVEKKDSEAVVEEYVDFLLSKIRPDKKLKIMIDCGNGAAGVVAGRLFKKAGFDVDMVFEEPAGDFPNRSPDNFEDPLTEAKKRVKEADFGVAFDGDGDRIVILNSNGETLTPEQTSCIILDELLKKEQGPVVANVECTKAIDLIPNKFNREVKRVRVGHTFLMDAVQRFGACFGVERTGHYVIPSLFPVDDSLAVSYYFACLASGKNESVSDIVKRIPEYPFKRINFECDDDKKFSVIDRLKEKLSGDFSEMNTEDGIRIDMDTGWVLIRASNTSSIIRLTMEGVRKEDLEDIERRFADMVKETINDVRN